VALANPAKNLRTDVIHKKHQIELEDGIISDNAVFFCKIFDKIGLM
jgi:hypothetical protein